MDPARHPAPGLKLVWCWRWLACSCPAVWCACPRSTLAFAPLGWCRRGRMVYVYAVVLTLVNLLALGSVFYLACRGRC